MRMVCAAMVVLAACGTDGDSQGPTDATSSDATDTKSGGDGKTTFDVPIPPDVPAPPACKTASECDDGLWCTGEETCSPDSLNAGADGCVAGVPPKGTDPAPGDCTVLATCDEATKTFPLVKLSAGAACDDGIACTTGDVCAADGDCAGAADDSRCDNGLYCDGVETCNTVVGCVAGQAPEGTDTDTGDCLVPGPCEEATHTFSLIPGDIGKPCNDGVDCTFDDACTGAGTCEGAPSDSFCDDEKYCNGAETCVKATGCLAGIAPKVPVDADPSDCLAYFACDEATQSWPLKLAPVDTVCSDGIGCTLGDACTADGTCTGSLDDAQCGDGLVCNGDETCSAAGCLPGTPPAAPADEDQTDCLAPAATCDEAAKGFPVGPVTEGSDCDDGQACTLGDKCGVAGECAGTPSNAECDDGEFCNGEETCTAAGCEPGAAPSGPPGGCATEVACDEETDTLTSLEDACDNGAFCDGLETCVVESGACASGEPPVAPEAQGCLSYDACDEETQSFPELTDDGACDDEDPCTADVCVSGTGACENDPAEDGTACDDGNALTTAEACHAGECTCVPECVDKACDAPDGCGGTCVDACEL